MLFQETSAEDDPQSNGAAESSVNVVKRTCQINQNWQWTCAASMHRRFAVGRDGKTVYERNVGRCAVHPWDSSVSEYGGCLQPSTRPLGPVDSRTSNFQRKCCQEYWYDSFKALPCTPDVNGNVGLRRYISWSRST